MTAIRRAIAALEHGQLHYRHCPAPGKPVLLLLHQSPSDSRMYLALMEQLAGTFDLLAPDNPGFGQSDGLPGGFTLPGCASALLEWLDGLGIESCYLFGHHTGASIAVQLAHQAPHRCQRLALCGPTLLAPEMQESLPGLAEPFPVDASGSHLQSMWQRMSGKEGDSPAELLLREVTSAFAAGDNYQQAYRAVAEQPFEAQLREIASPVLVFAGTRDILYDRLDASYACLQQGSRAEVEGAGSYVCDRHPEEVAGLLREFFHHE